MHEYKEDILYDSSKIIIQDEFVFYGNIYGNICYIIVYVDDLILACSMKEQIKYIESTLSRNFAIENLSKLKQYLGIEISKDPYDNFQLCQSNFINKTVQKFGL